MRDTKPLAIQLLGAADGGVTVYFRGYEGGPITEAMAKRLQEGLTRAVAVANLHAPQKAPGDD